MTEISTGPLRFTDEDLKARALSDSELRQNILDEAVDLVRRLKTENDEKTWKDEAENGICIVVDLIHPVDVFLSPDWGPDMENLIYDDYRYRFVNRRDFGSNCLDSVFKYLGSPDWKAFVAAINFSSVEFDQPWVERTPDPDMSWV